MLNVHRHAAPQSRACAAHASQLGADIDLERAPIVFGWLLYRRDRFDGAVHLETLYRLNRVGDAAEPGQASLQASAYHGQSIEMLRALMHVQQHQRLPPAPRGCRWLGPQLVSEVKMPPTRPLPSGSPPAQDQAWPAGRRARLAFARAIARRLLHGSQGA